ncbi:MAG: winged helix-turn-helix domain-containing protein [Eubacteriales bacterium]
MVFENERLFQIIWNADSFGDYRTLAVHISNIRRKIEKQPRNPKYIHTIKGVGYKFSCEQEERPERSDNNIISWYHHMR